MRLRGFAGCDLLLRDAAPVCHCCSAALGRMLSAAAAACPGVPVATLWCVLSTCSVCVSMYGGGATEVIGRVGGGRSWFGLWMAAEWFGMTRMSSCRSDSGVE